MSSLFSHRLFRALDLPLCSGLSGMWGTVSSVHAQLGKPEGLYYRSWAVVIGIENYLVAPKVPGLWKARMR